MRNDTRSNDGKAAFPEDLQGLAFNKCAWNFTLKKY